MRTSQPKLNFNLKWAIGIGVTLLLAVIVLMSFTIVEPGHRGVYVITGKAQLEPFTEGMHFILFYGNVKEIDVRQKLYEDKATKASSKDMQQVFTKIAVNYKPEPTAIVKLYKDVSGKKADWERILIHPAVEEITKSVTALYSAEELIQKREEAKAAITERIIKRLQSENIIVVQVSITDFDFNSKFLESIENKQIAEQKAKQASFELQQKKIDFEQRSALAEENKKARIAEAQGIQQEIQLLSGATDRYLKLKFLEKWDGILPKVFGGEIDMLINEDLDK